MSANEMIFFYEGKNVEMKPAPINPIRFRRR
jgi:hypothetical protein